jgi:hypothetical protein
VAPAVIDGTELDWPTKPEHWCDPDPPTDDDEPDLEGQSARPT